MKIQTEQIKKKDDAHVADALNGGGVADKSDARGSHQAAERDIGDQHRLAQVQGGAGEHGGAGKNQKYRKYNDVALHDDGDRELSARVYDTRREHPDRRRSRLAARRARAADPGQCR